RAEEGDARRASLPTVRLLDARDELRLRDPRLCNLDERRDREVGERGGAAEPLDLLGRLDSSQRCVLARHVDEIEMPKVEVVLPRHAVAPRRVDSDEP